MAEGGGEERAGFSAIAKSQRKYGSTSNHMKRNEVLIKHIVSPGETLQGIALRYGVTMEQIKRANKIWTNDSLFLRKTLDVPVPRSSLDELCWDENMRHNNGSSHDENASHGKANSTKTNIMSIGDAVLHENSATLDDPTITNNGTNDKSDQSIADILIRIDSSIAQTKSQVEKREKKQEYYSDDNMYSPRRLSYQARMRQSLAKQQQTDPQVAIQPAAMTQGKKVQTSLQRHQREQDEMFEL